MQIHVFLMTFPFFFGHNFPEQRTVKLIQIHYTCTWRALLRVAIAALSNGGSGCRHTHLTILLHTAVRFQISQLSHGTQNVYMFIQGKNIN
jgi:hypothetical protein